ncbi:hypothetical protein SmJEL517_g05639 [Synchytrium microbalum]|uniref:Uncharacterized protein n=1 Tax=Synchytrium microbalum TaxID=1806994 RepID=A0A507BTB5_9FUNG|nr:uncharacterized protein SmJEL517_g05639 [Synchytrium microbalum]TPX30862.1 hypothetical protein SmJEL517_g05639 [Synchytrium microbalum]
MFRRKKPEVPHAKAEEASGKDDKPEIKVNKASHKRCYCFLIFFVLVFVYWISPPLVVKQPPLPEILQGTVQDLINKISIFGDIDASQYLSQDLLAKNLSAMFEDMAGRMGNKPQIADDSFSVGSKLIDEEGLSKVKHPVVFIPGLVSKLFPKKALGHNEPNFGHPVKLDPKTGGDPPSGFKLRASLGLDSADYLFPGYWVLAKLISNLAALKYDSNSMFVMGYDWRLSMKNMELRDHLFSPAGGNAGESWAEQYLYSHVDISGPLLGVPKAVSALLSGETRDTAQFSSLATNVLERAFSRRERTDLFRSWGVLPSMIPKGGSAIWGNLNLPSLDEDPNKIPSFAAMLAIRGTRNLDLDVDASIAYLIKEVGDLYWTKEHQFGSAQSSNEAEHARNDDTAWTNPLLAPLPSFKTNYTIYCLYGIGKPTERKYFYTAESEGSSCVPSDDTNHCLDEKAVDAEGVTHAINTSMNADTTIENGVELSDGDGTVNLLSLAYMCAKGWRSSKSVVNPSRVRVVSREYLNVVSPSLNSRGGPECSDHTDILGNHGVIEDVLRLATGENLEDKWVEGGAQTWVEP